MCFRGRESSNAEPIWHPTISRGQDEYKSETAIIESIWILLPRAFLATSTIAQLFFGSLSNREKKQGFVFFLYLPRGVPFTFNAHLLEKDITIGRT